MYKEPQQREAWLASREATGVERSMAKSHFGYSMGNFEICAHEIH